MRFGRDRRYSRDVRVKKCGNGNTVTGKRIVYSRREDGEIGIFGSHPVCTLTLLFIVRCSEYKSVS